MFDYQINRDMLNRKKIEIKNVTFEERDKIE